MLSGLPNPVPPCFIAYLRSSGCCTDLQLVELGKQRLERKANAPAVLMIAQLSHHAKKSIAAINVVTQFACGRCGELFDQCDLVP